MDTTYTPDVDNRLLTAGSLSFGYDDNGNLITKTLGSNVTNYSWDFNDMLTQITKDGNTYVYRYDALGNRVAKVVNSVETRYVGGLAETDVSGNITAYYVYGLGLISKITPSDQAYYYHFDGLGSTIAVTDSSGNVINKYAYDEHGKVLNQEEAISNPFKYVGRFGVMDEGNGLLYMRARYYDPEIGRFISKDPIGFVGGLNLYAYAGSNPVNRIDPWGLFWEYQISTGYLWHFRERSDGTVEPGEYVGQGFSGGGDGSDPLYHGLNDALYQLEKDFGPILEGDWTIGPLETVVKTDGTELPLAMRLWPKKGTNTFDRYGFIIHGGKVSQGCPIFNDEAIRKRIGNSGDKTWRVVR